MFGEREHLVAYAPHCNDICCCQPFDIASHQYAPSYINLQIPDQDWIFIEDRRYDTLDVTCKDIFEEREQQIRKANMARKKLARNAAWSARVKSNETGSGGKGKRPKAPCHVKLPHIDLPYIDSLRENLSHVIYFGHQDEPTRWEWDFQFKHIERALLHLLFVDKHYQAVISAIDKIFSSPRHEDWPKCWTMEINLIWYESWYYLDPSRKERADMTPVNTFRIRRKNPSPLEKPFGKTKYNMTESAINVLKLFLKNSETGRPSKDDKDILVFKTGLSIETVTNWFKNKRQRDTKHKRRDAKISSAASTISADSGISLSKSSPIETEATSSSPTLSSFTSEKPLPSIIETNIDDLWEDVSWSGQYNFYGDPLHQEEYESPCASLSCETKSINHVLARTNNNNFLE